MTYLSSAVLEQNIMIVEEIRAPEHLLSYSWFELEKNQAERVFNDLEKIVGKLDKKLSPKRVHQARVVLRRWYSIWDILAIDGWEDSGYPSGGFEKSIGSQLRAINKELGKIRDFDVSLDLAEELDLNKQILRELKRERKKLKKKAARAIIALKPGKVIERLRRYLADRADQLQYAFTEERQDSVLVKTNHSAYFHLNQFLLQAEHQTRLLSENSVSDEELHELRLSIKRWRYLLSEFFGLTNLELVRAQQILGRIRDLQRLAQDIHKLKKPLRRSVLAGRISAKALDGDRRAVANLLADQQRQLLPLIDRLPFGLRPYLLSL